MIKKQHYLVVLLGAAVVRLAGADGGMRFTLKPEVLDFDLCAAQPGNLPAPLTATSTNLEIVDWQTAATPTQHTGEFVLRFLEPTAVGTVFAYEPGAVSYSVSNTWKPLPVGRNAGRKLKVMPLPAGERIDALKFSVPAQAVAGAEAASYRATLPFASLVPVRVVDIARDATVTASASNALSQPAILVDGIVDSNQLFSISRPAPLLDASLSPSVVLSWNQTQSVRGLALFFEGPEPEVTAAHIQAFVAAGDPREARGNSGWEFLTTYSSSPGQFWGERFFVLGQERFTRGLRIQNTNNLGQLGLREILVMTGADPTARSGAKAEVSKPVSASP